MSPVVATGSCVAAGAPVPVTATLTPRSGVPVLAAAEPDARLAEYLTVFRRLMATPEVSAVVFAENSGADLAPFADIARTAGRADSVELLSVEPVDWRPDDGRG